MKAITTFSKALKKSSAKSIAPIQNTIRFYSSENNNNNNNNNNNDDGEHITSKRALLTGMPKDQLSRTVIIYKPAPYATQQAIGTPNEWKLEWKKQSAHGEIWKDPLMGWNATNDPLATTSLFFPNAEDAIDYCKRHGYDYQLIEDRTRDKYAPIEQKSYANKFKYKPEEEEW
ncbi:hypothetical protein ABK040_015616 [Willaertia magna]